MIAELIGPESARWRQMLEATAHDVYHRPGYGPLLEPPGAREVALHVQGEDAELLLPMVLKPVPDLGDPSLSGWWDAASPYGYPGPLVRGAFLSWEVERLQDCVLALLRERQILTCFVRGSPLLAEGDPLLERLGTAVVLGETAIIELERSEEEIWNSCSSTHRRQVRRIQQRGYWVQVDDWAHLPAFMALYEETMRRVGAREFYFFGADYFHRLKRLLGDQLHLISVLSPAGEVASAGLVTACGGMANAHLNGSSGAHLPLAPGRMLHDFTWRWAKQRGERVLNYGGGTGRKDDPLFAFKKSFATATRPFRTARVISDPGVYQRACRAAGVSGEDLAAYFPAYRQPPAQPGALARAARPASPRASPAAGCSPGA